MIKPTAVLLLLLTLALLARLDRDGILAHSGVAARGLGLELRLEVKLQRASPSPIRAGAPGIPCDTTVTAPGVTPCD